MILYLSCCTQKLCRLPPATWSHYSDSNLKTPRHQNMWCDYPRQQHSNSERCVAVQQGRKAGGTQLCRTQFGRKQEAWLWNSSTRCSKPGGKKGKGSSNVDGICAHSMFSNMQHCNSYVMILHNQILFCSAAAVIWCLVILTLNCFHFLSLWFNSVGQNEPFRGYFLSKLSHLKRTHLNVMCEYLNESSPNWS